MAKCAPARTAVVAADRWSPAVYTSSGPTDPKLIAVANDNRRSLLVILTLGSAGLGQLRARANASSADGAYPLEQVGEGVTINTSGEVYFVAATGAGATVKVIEEIATNG